MKKKLLWKFMRTGLKSESGTEKDWVIGEWRHEDSISICNYGFHASDTPLQALGYVNGEILAQVEVKGESVVEDDKSCWSDMRVVKAYHWEKQDSVALSIYAAELCIENYEKQYPNDTRPRDAVEAAKKVLVADTKENRSAAAWSARSARSAAAAASVWSARSAAAAASAAASAAVWSARSARSAASAAASAAVWSARSARSAAAEKKLIASLDEWFIKRIKDLEPYA